MTTPTNTSLSVEHYTPEYIVTPSRAALGGRIDLDPASCAVANSVVQADAFHTTDALFVPWFGRIFLNPPGGKLDPDTLQPTKGPGLSATAVWWGKLLQEWQAGRVEQAIFVAFNTGVFRTAQLPGFGISMPPQAFPFCMPRERICFDVVGPDGKRTPGKSPPQDSAIVYLPDNRNDQTMHVSTSRFLEAFAHLGHVVTHM